MIGWESTNILPQCECTQLGASQVQLWVAARGHGNLWICLWFASQADPSLIYEDINLLQSCQVGVRTSYSQVAPYNCSCWAFERRMAWILPRVLVWRLEETFQPHLALCSCVLQWTEWLPGLQVDRGKNDLLKPVLEQTSVSYFPTWIVFDSPHCSFGGLVQQILWMPYSSPVEVALLQKGKAVQVEDIPRDGSPRNVPLWILMEEAILFKVLCYGILQPLNKGLTRSLESGIWEQLFCNVVTVSPILPVTSLYFLRVGWWILRRWNYGRDGEIMGRDGKYCMWAFFQKNILQVIE